MIFGISIVLNVRWRIKRDKSMEAGSGGGNKFMETLLCTRPGQLQTGGNGKIREGSLGKGVT